MVHRGNIGPSGAAMLVIGDSVNNVGLREANSQVYKKGELLQRNSSGAIIRCATIIGGGNDKLDASAVAVGKDTKVMGIALKDGSNVTSGNPIAPFAWLKPGDIIEGNLVDGSDGDAPTGYVALATDIGRMVAIVFDATRSQWYFTVNAGEECAMVYSFLGTPGNTDTGGIGDTNARVSCAITSDILKLANLVTVA